MESYGLMYGGDHTHINPNKNETPIMFSSNEYQYENLSFGLVKYKHFCGWIEKRVDHREEILIQRKDRKSYTFERYNDGSVVRLLYKRNPSTGKIYPHPDEYRSFSFSESLRGKRN
jgi:hypothetical protein